MIEQSVNLWTAESYWWTFCSGSSSSGGSLVTALSRLWSSNTSDIVGPVTNFDLGIEQQMRWTGQLIGKAINALEETSTIVIVWKVACAVWTSELMVRDRDDITCKMNMCFDKCDITKNEADKYLPCEQGHELAF